MLILASTTDVVNVVTGSAGLVDVHASWMDNAAGAVGPGRTNTPTITTATTTTVVPSPASGTQRNLKTLHVRNRGASANSINVIHTDGTTAVILLTISLASGATLEYIDEVGFMTVLSGVQ